jgi:3-hydroxymyristoyl/3-hydroxydecanoyl-(acyl carrier protein) dehydratase/1-acyl-sn-glycerol-3-phosphate acyltransferase
MSRINAVTGPIGGMKVGTSVSVDYDIPEDVWYFDENGNRTMPFAVLLEAALQPCGWLASYVGSALTVDHELSFRNLDGTGTLHGELFDDAGTLRTEVTITKISESAGMIIESFDVECYLGDRNVYSLQTVFGFFPLEAMANQVGLGTSDAQRALLTETSERATVDVRAREGAWFEASRPRVAEPMLMMIDRVTGVWPTGGEHGLGRVRGEKDVDAGEWFFAAHFFQDPVQPGSLGLEALVQLLQLFMLDAELDSGLTDPRFEPIELGRALTWKYRGQVIPDNAVISSTLDIVEVGRDERGAFAVAEGSLWVDGKRIYEAKNLGMRIVEGGPGGRDPSKVEDPAGSNVPSQAPSQVPTEVAFAASNVPSQVPTEVVLSDDGAAAEPELPEGLMEVFDPASHAWLGDHRPTYTAPALPMMSMIDLLARSVPGATGLRDVRVKGWLVMEAPTRLRTVVEGDPKEPTVTLWTTLGNDSATLAREVARARVVREAVDRPEPWAELEGEAEESPYASGHLFHGPAFQHQTRWVCTGEGSSSRCDIREPDSTFHPVLLDVATHGIPHDELHRWDDRVPEDRVAYPAWIPAIDFFGPAPEGGEGRIEARAQGIVGTAEFFSTDVQIIVGDDVWCAFRLVEATFPKGRLGALPPAERRAFLSDRQWVPGATLGTTTEDGATELQLGAVAETDWLPGTVRALYGTRDLAEIACRERAAEAHQLHPGRVFESLPLTRFSLSSDGDAQHVRVTGDATGSFDIRSVKDFWTEWFGVGRWPVEDLYYGLIERFVRRVVVEDRDALEAVRGRSCLFLANHQVGVESLIFSILASGLLEVPTVTLAKAEHRHTWLGRLIELCFRYPGVPDPKVIAFFDREDKESLPGIIRELGTEMRDGGRSVMVHVEGTRSLSCREPVQKMSGAFVDMALAVGAPVVPVRFVGGLPSAPLERRVEFPGGPEVMGRQDIYFGAPMLPETLATMHYGARKAAIIEAINALGPDNAVEEALPGDAALVERVSAWQERTGATHEHAALASVLEERGDLHAALRGILDGDDPAPGAAREWLVELSARLHGAG